jgi:hypothetical protein
MSLEPPTHDRKRKPTQAPDPSVTSTRTAHDRHPRDTKPRRVSTDAAAAATSNISSAQANAVTMSTPEQISDRQSIGKLIQDLSSPGEDVVVASLDTLGRYVTCVFCTGLCNGQRLPDRGGDSCCSGWLLCPCPASEDICLEKVIHEIPYCDPVADSKGLTLTI